MIPIDQGGRGGGWPRSELADVTGEGSRLRSVRRRQSRTKHLARTVHDLYFKPKYEQFKPRPIWSLSNAFPSAFKEPDPIPQFKATARPGDFLQARFSQLF